MSEKKCLYCEKPLTDFIGRKTFADMSESHNFYVFIDLTDDKGWQLNINIDEEYDNFNIKYCPMCGRKVSEV